MAGMRGGEGKTIDFLNQLFPAQPSRFVQTFALDQFCNGRAAGHGGYAAFGAKANVGDAVTLKLQGKFEDVSADRVFQSCGAIGSCNGSGVAWVLKVVEKFGRIHIAIVMRQLFSAALEARLSTR